MRYIMVDKKGRIFISRNDASTRYENSWLAIYPKSADDIHYHPGFSLMPTLPHNLPSFLFEEQYYGVNGVSYLCIGGFIRTGKKVYNQATGEIEDEEIKCNLTHVGVPTHPDYTIYEESEADAAFKKACELVTLSVRNFLYGHYES